MNYMELNGDLQKAEIGLIGIPYEGTTSYRSGTKFAPVEIRTNSLIGYETYSPRLNKDLEQLKLYDFGDIDLPLTSPEIIEQTIQNEIKKLLELKLKPSIIGGEHSITTGVVKALKYKYKNLKVIQLDAHADLREQYSGTKHSHACAMKRVVETIGGKNLYQIGIRSGTKEEFLYGQKNTNFFPYNLKKIDEVIKRIGEEPVYITIDLDVLDPSFLPGTGTPEPDGVTSNELFETIYKLQKLPNIVGFDIVELSPFLDQSQASTSLAIKLLREMLLIL